MKFSYAIIIIILLLKTAHASVIGAPPVAASQATTLLGPVATSAMIPNSENITASQSCMTRKAHIARTSITNIRVAMANWFVTLNVPNPGSESGTDNSIAVQEWIEYPNGTYTPLTFSGISTATIQNLTTQLSDYLTLSIPNGTTFYEWTHVVGSGGSNFPLVAEGIGNPLFVSGGEAANCGTSGVPVTPGSITDNGNGSRGYWSSAVLGKTSQPTFFIIGDSRTQGVHEAADSSYDLGDVARSVGPSYAYINDGISGQRCAGWVAHHDLQSALAAYATVIIDQLCYNEFNQQSMPVANVEAYKQNIQAHFKGRIYVDTTIEPWTSSSNSWIDLAGQTLNGQTTSMNTYNDWVRSLSPGVGYAELSNAVSTAQDSGFWISNGTPNFYTPDGIHPSTNGSLAIKSFGGVDPVAIAASTPININFPTLNLTSGGSIAYSTGIFSQGLSSGFPSVNGILPGSAPFTEELWLKTSSSSFQYAANLNAQIYINHGGAGAGTIGYRVGGGFSDSSAVVNDNAWHFVAFGYSNGVAKLYVDCAVVLTQTLNTPSSNIGNIGAMAIGAGNSSGLSPWSGVLDEVAIWNYDRYASSCSVPTQPYIGTELGLMGLWHLDSNLNGVRGSGGM